MPNVLTGVLSGTSSIIRTQPLTATENGTYNPPSGVDGYKPVTVNVPQHEPVIEQLTALYNGVYNAPSGVDGYDPVVVNVPAPAPVLDDITITENGHYVPPTGVDGYDDITVNVPAPAPVLDDITITENGHYTPPTGVDGYDDITVNVPLPANAYLKQTLSGLPSPIATFTGADAPLDSLKVSIEGVQSGSGDPSPSNVRPISGWSEANVTNFKNNLWDGEDEQGYYNTTTGQPVESQWFMRCKNKLPVKPNTSLYVATTGVRILFYDNNDNYISYTSSIGVITTPSNCYYIRFYIGNDGYTGTFDINYPSSVTTTSTIYNKIVYVSFGQDVYGGVLNVSTGELTITHICINIDENTSITFNSSINGCVYQNSGFVPSISAETIGNYISNRLKAHINSGISSMSNEFTVDGTSAIIFKVDGLTTLEAYKTWLETNNLQFVAPLATPQTIQLTPTQVRTISGNNNISVNCGEVTELEYFTQS